MMWTEKEIGNNKGSFTKHEFYMNQFIFSGKNARNMKFFSISKGYEVECLDGAQEKYRNSMRVSEQKKLPMSFNLLVELFLN